MAINLFCGGCKVTSGLRAKSCRKCGEPFGAIRKYRVDVKSPEGKRVSRVVDSLAMARQLEAKLKTDALKGELLGLRSVPCLSEVWEQYLAWAKLNKKTWADDLGHWNNHIAPLLASKVANRVTALEVQGVLDRMRLKGRYAPATLKHVLVVMRRLYNWSRDMGLLSCENPANLVEAPKLNNQRTECLSREELGRLFQTLEEWKNRRIALLVQFALLTGCRRGEILKLRWDDVDLEALTVRLRDPKGGTDAILPLSIEAGCVLRAALDALPFQGCSYVFPNGRGQRRHCVKGSWRRIKEQAGLPVEFRFHGLRHCFASYLASSGEVTLYTIQKLLNHKSSRMTERYAHLLDDTLRAGVGVLGKVIRD